MLRLTPELRGRLVVGAVFMALIVAISVLGWLNFTVSPPHPAVPQVPTAGTAPAASAPVAPAPSALGAAAAPAVELRLYFVLLIFG